MKDTLIVCAGHICLDVIPSIPPQRGGLNDVLVPGKLLDVGPVVTGTGGAVSNTGLALHRLGMNVKLMGKVGDDPFGRIVLDRLRAEDAALSEGMIVGDDPTSYTVVINIPDVDRIFLHCPGANDTFAADNIDGAKLQQAGLFHFGYPPLMRTMFQDGGIELATIFQRAKNHGATTSLDMALPDPASPAGKADWPTILERVLPYVDVFLPSLDEIEYMTGYTPEGSPAERAAAIAPQLLDRGVAVTLIKLGDHGAGLYTCNAPERLQSMGRCAPSDVEAWRGIALTTACYQVDAVGTTGAGDCTIAGFLAGLVQGQSPADALTTAVATGACSVEAANATDAIIPWDKLQARISGGWPKRPGS